MTKSGERRVLTTGSFKPMPRIVCLCGSTRFYNEFQKANYEETMAGNIVLSVGFYRDYAESVERHRTIFHGDSIGCTPEQKIALDELHKRKIDLADEILVLNVGGYIGASTRSEIEYAESLGMPIRYLEPIEAHLTWKQSMDFAVYWRTGNNRDPEAKKLAKKWYTLGVREEREAAKHEQEG